MTPKKHYAETGNVQARGMLTTTQPVRILSAQGRQLSLNGAINPDGGPKVAEGQTQRPTHLWLISKPFE